MEGGEEQARGASNISRHSHCLREDRLSRTFGGWFTAPEADSPYLTKVPHSYIFMGVGSSTTYTTSWVTVRPDHLWPAFSTTEERN